MTGALEKRITRVEATIPLPNPMTPHRVNRRKHIHGLFGMTADTALILACILSALIIVW